MSAAQSPARVIAQRALGKPLPAGAEIHHVNGNPKDNRRCNLVICQNKAYHHYLHQRMRARGYVPPKGSFSFIVRDIDDDLWRQAKVKAAQEGVSLKVVMLTLIRDWVKVRATKAAK